LATILGELELTVREKRPSIAANAVRLEALANLVTTGKLCTGGALRHHFSALTPECALIWCVRAALSDTESWKFHELRHDGALAWNLQFRGPDQLKPPARSGEQPEVNQCRRLPEETS